MRKEEAEGIDSGTSLMTRNYNIGVKEPGMFREQVYVDEIRLRLTGRCTNCYGLRRFTTSIRKDDTKPRVRNVAWACKECKAANVSSIYAGMLIEYQSRSLLH
jgi:hypothetical protein